MDSLANKKIIITGASSGIGKAIAEEASKVGAHIVLASRTYEKLIELKQDLVPYGNTIVCVQTDVTKPEDCDHLIKESVDQLGGVDILINNAGISMRAPFEHVKLDVLKEVMNVNYWGAVYCTKAALPELLKSKGSLVAVSSVTGFKGLPGRTAYASSKFALNGLFESLRMEYMSRGLHTLIACPGFTTSNIRFNALTADGSEQGDTPLDEKKIDKPEDVAKDILQAIRDRKDFMLTNKQGKLMFWVNKFFPKYLEKKIHNVIAKEPNSPILE